MSAPSATARRPAGPPPQADRSRALAPGEVRILAVLIAVGVALRLWIAGTNYGVGYDTDTATTVARLLASHPLHAYASLRWPYPPGYFPILIVCRWISEATGQPFWALWKVPSILGDAGLALALVWGTGRLGASPGARLATAALVMLGPVFVIVSGYHGQLDPVAVLPALIAVVVWRGGGGSRAVTAGLLVGLGAMIKTVPFFMVFALLPTARDRREAALVVGCAIAVPLLAIAPFLLADAHATTTSLTFNHGVAGLGGPSVLVQPSLTHGWLYGNLPRPSAATRFLTREQNLLDGLGVLAAAALVLWRRMDAVRAAGVIWLAVYLANVNWAYQYFDWGLPFFLLAGWRREVLALQALILIPAVEMYFRFDVSVLGHLVIPLSVLTWVIFAGALAYLAAGETSGEGTRRGRWRLRGP